MQSLLLHIDVKNVIIFTAFIFPLQILELLASSVLLSFAEGMNQNFTLLYALPTGM